MLRFLLPILIVLIIGAAVAIYVVLIHPVNQEEETTTAAPTTTEVTTEATTTEETTEATTEEAECPYEYSQKITVTAHAGSTSGTLTVYNWEHGDWVNKYSVACVLGRNGIGSDYGEGKGGSGSKYIFFMQMFICYRICGWILLRLRAQIVFCDAG